MARGMCCRLCVLEGFRGFEILKLLDTTPPRGPKAGGSGVSLALLLEVTPRRRGHLFRMPKVLGGVMGAQ